MRDGTAQLIDNAIGIAGAACGIGLSLKIGWVAGVQDLDPVSTVLMLPAAAGLLLWFAAVVIGSLLTPPFAITKIFGWTYRRIGR